jgi:hypothetical protein
VGLSATCAALIDFSKKWVDWLVPGLKPRSSTPATKTYRWGPEPNTGSNFIGSFGFPGLRIETWGNRLLWVGGIERGFAALIDFQKNKVG